MRVSVITPPAPIVTWEEADEHLRLDGDEEQKGLVERLVRAATGHIDGPDGWLGRALGPQTLEARMSGFCNIVRLPYGPIIDIVSAHYLDAQGQTQLVEANTYELFGDDLGVAWGKSWPAVGTYRGNSETVRVQYRAGYAVEPTAELLAPNVPEPIKQAVLLMVGDMWHSRATVATGSTMQTVPMSTKVECLLSPLRLYV